MRWASTMWRGPWESVAFAVDHMRTDLVERALDQALGWREPADGMFFHSDRGSVYTSKDYRDKLDQHGILASMSRKGNCWVNAVSESLFGTYKPEEADCSHWSGLVEARAATIPSGTAVRSTCWGTSGVGSAERQPTAVPPRTKRGTRSTILDADSTL